MDSLVRALGLALLTAMVVGCAQGGASHVDDPLLLQDGGTGLDAGDGGGTDGGEHGQQLPCDPGFSVSPNPPETSKVNKVSYESGAYPYTYVDYVWSGPGQTAHENLAIVQYESPSVGWRWTWDVTFTEDGIYTVHFGASEIDEPNRPSCQFSVIGNGNPPSLEPPFDDPNCAQSCPVVGTNLAGPTTFPPPGWQGDWITLDSAGGCADGHCLIWCPHDYSQPGNHYLEGAWLSWDERHMSYEAACQSYCENTTGSHWYTNGHYCGPPTKLMACVRRPGVSCGAGELITSY